MLGHCRPHSAAHSANVKDACRFSAVQEGGQQMGATDLQAAGVTALRLPRSFREQHRHVTHKALRIPTIQETSDPDAARLQAAVV